MHSSPSITIVGLGPGDPGLVTRAVWQVLSTASEVYVRTDQHPTLAALPPGLAIHSFDALYAAADDFAAVYEQITEQVLALGSRPQGVLYAVPGDPGVGEAAVQLIRERAATRGLPVTVLSGVSFIEPACLALGLDPLAEPGLQIVDAMLVAASHAPRLDPAQPALLPQCYSRSLASDVKLTLLHSFPPTHPVTVLAAAGTAQQSVRVTPLYALDRSVDFDHLTTLYLPPAGAQASFAALQEIVAHLRAPEGGCPWDREQTLDSLRPDLLEEIYELLEALDGDDDGKICEELGDAVLSLTMMAQIAAEEERFQWPEVMQQVNDKLIRRHPHVFGDLKVGSVDEVLDNWAAIKQAERAASAASAPASPLASVPRALPALALASTYQTRLHRAQIAPDLSAASPLARALWELVAEARAAGVDAESELRTLCVQVASQPAPPVASPAAS